MNSRFLAEGFSSVYILIHPVPDRFNECVLILMSLKGRKAKQ